jgi:hypothetical protein
LNSSKVLKNIEVNDLLNIEMLRLGIRLRLELRLGFRLSLRLKLSLMLSLMLTGLPDLFLISRFV